MPDNGVIISLSAVFVPDSDDFALMGDTLTAMSRGRASTGAIAASVVLHVHAATARARYATRTRS